MQVDVWVEKRPMMCHNAQWLPARNRTLTSTTLDTALKDSTSARERWLQLYRTMLTGREIDRGEVELVREGLAFFHVSGAGHEGSAALAAHLTHADWLHCHYRDKALLLARG